MSLRSDLVMAAVRKAEREWLEDGVIHLDTEINLMGLGIDINSLTDTFREINEEDD